MSSQEELTAVWEQRYAALYESRKRRAEREDAAQERDRGAGRGVIAQVGTQRFAVPMGNVVEILPLATGSIGTMVPGAPPEFWGLIIVRGEVRPVFDLGALLDATGNSEKKGEEAGHVLFVRSGEGLRDSDVLGVRVDRVEGIVLLPGSNTIEPSSLATMERGRFVSYSVTVSVDDPLLQIVDIPALLAHMRGGDQVDTASPPVATSSESFADDFALRSIEEE